MRKSTRLAMVGLSVLATSAMVAGTAAAQTGAGAGSYGAQANAESLMISVAGTQITGSKAVASLDNPGTAPTSKALATMLLTPAFDSGAVEVSADSVKTSDANDPTACLENPLEAIPGIARLDVTCPEVSAAVTDGLPSARALGAQLVLEPSVSGVLDTLGLQEPVVEGVNTVFEDVLNPLVEALTGNPIGDLADDAVTTVQDVLNDTLTLNSTARVVVAPALSEVTTTADKVTAVAHSQGIRVELLPVNEVGATNGLLPDDLLPGEPLVTITIGNAFAKCTYTRGTTDKCVAEHASGLVTIEFGSTALTDALGVPADPITVPVGASQCILIDTPLETCVNVATSGVDAEGNPYATSSSVELFKGVNGGVILGTGGVTSGSAGAPIVAAALPAGDLPRTGGSDALPIMGAGLLALAVLGRRVAIGRA